MGSLALGRRLAGTSWKKGTEVPSWLSFGEQRASACNLAAHSICPSARAVAGDAGRATDRGAVAPGVHSALCFRDQDRGLLPLSAKLHEKCPAMFGVGLSFLTCQQASYFLAREGLGAERGPLGWLG